MSKTKNQNTSPNETRSDCCCPLCYLAKNLKEAKRRHSEFYDHLSNAHMEMLLAVKSLIKHRISKIEEQKGSRANKRKVSKIEVE